MKKLKLFSKTYIFTMALISMIIIISHILIYLGLPKVYISNKEKESDNIIEDLIKEINKVDADIEKSFKLAKNFSEKYNIKISLTLNEEKKTFQGHEDVDIYLDQNSVSDETIVLPDIKSDSIIKDYEEGITGSKSEEDFNQYININNSSIIKSKSFKTINDINGNIQMAMDLESFTETRDVILKILPYSILVSLFIALIASYIYSKKITTPIKEICDVTKEMENLNKRAFCKVETEDEIGILAYNINNLYENLLNTIVSLEEEIENVSKSEKIKVDFLRSASHELKTPLMSMHIMLENMILGVGKYKNHDIYLEKCKEVVNQLSKMVQEILDTSRLNTLDNKNEKIIDLSQIVNEIVDTYKLIAKSRQINININLEDSFNISIDEKLFTKAISNIISNAVNYTDEGKEIRIYIKNNKLIIENDCTPISNEHLEHIFEAFYRVDFDRNKSSGGNGLGLYIVQQILTITKLTYSFKPIKNGMKFEIDFNNKNII